MTLDQFVFLNARLIELLGDGKEGAAEVDAIRTRLDRPWQRMSQADRREVYRRLGKPYPMMPEHLEPRTLPVPEVLQDNQL